MMMREIERSARPMLTQWVLLSCALLVPGLMLAPTPGSGQEFWGNYTPVGPGLGLPDIPGGFTFCRLAYTSVRRTESGNGWRVDFPRADRHILARLSELTPTPVSRWSEGEAGFAVVTAMDLDLYQCPFLFASDVGQLGFHPDEIALMRDYLLKGGFLWVDDYWGNHAWGFFAAEIGRVFPEFDIIDLPMDHPLFDIVYTVPEIPQIPNVGFWRRSGGQTSELGPASAEPSMRAILDDDGRILVLMTHNTDIADGWERDPDDDAYFALFSPDAYAIGVNVMIWVMTH